MILKLIQLHILSACFNVKLGLRSDPLIFVALELFLPPNIMPETDIRHNSLSVDRYIFVA